MWHRLMGWVAWVAVAFVAGPGWGAVKSWNDGSDNWSNGADWTPAGVPGAGDSANIVFGDGVARTVTYDYTGSAVTLGSLSVDLTNPGANVTTLSMAANTLAAGSELVGANGAGTINQTGGTNTVTGNLTIGGNASGLGQYNLSDSTLQVNGTEYIGSSATGNGTQRGGTFTQDQTFNDTTHNVGALVIGNAAGSTGYYNFLFGTLTSSLGETIGNAGDGLLAQTYGTNSCAGNINIAAAATSTGTYSMTGGTTTAPNVFVGGTSSGSGGSGVFTVSSTNSTTFVNVAGTITIYNTPGTRLNLQSGTLTAAAINVNGTPSLFNWTGGTLNILNDITWDSAASSTSTASIFGSSVNLSSKLLKINGNETIGGNGAFTMSLGGSGSGNIVSGNITVQPGGTLSTGSNSTLTYTNLTLAGGTISGTLRNTSNFIYQSGNFSAGLINDGTVTLGASFSMFDLTNDTLMTVGGNQLLTISGNTTNNGTFVLNGGTLSGFGTFTNTISGTLTAHGSFAQKIVNHGTMNIDGVLTLQSFQANTNDGILQGVGTISNSSNSSFSNSAGGVINSTTSGGALVFTSFSTNSAGGIMNVGPTSTLSITSSWTNSGLVNLQGASAKLSGGTLTNNGIIQGSGAINSSISTSSTGVFRASGGELDFTASILSSLPSSSQIQVGPGSTVMFLQGLAGTSGTISISGGTFDNAGKPLTNSGMINGYGILRTGGLTISSTKTLVVGEGNMEIFGNVTNNGSVAIQGGKSAYFYGAVNGSGNYTGTGTAVFLASLSPGNSPALVNFAGDVMLVGGTSLAMELGGTAVGSGYDKIHVAGQLSIGGTLSVSLINSFNPAIGNTFDLLDWDSLAGTFSSLSLPTLAAGQWDTSLLYTSGVISVVASPGDFNRDGGVNSADYVSWRKGVGMAYVANDYDVWRENFAQASSSSGIALTRDTAVPEPATVAMLFIAAGAMFVRRGGHLNGGVNISLSA